MKLIVTPYEFKILEHRLEVPDCIADALTDVEEGQPAPDRNEVLKRIKEIQKELKTVGEVEVTDELTKSILHDCVDGSTYFADMEDAVAWGRFSRGDALANHRSATRLEQKLDKIGIRAYFPRC